MKPARGRKLLTVRLADDSNGWLLEGISTAGSWHATILDAVVFAGQKTAGSETENRILGVKGQTTHVVLVPGKVGPSRR